MPPKEKGMYVIGTPGAGGWGTAITISGHFPATPSALQQDPFGRRERCLGYIPGTRHAEEGTHCVTVSIPSSTPACATGGVATGGVITHLEPH